MSSLLLRPDKAGDALKTLPALRALRAARPEEEIHLLVSAHNESLFAHEPGVQLHRELPEREFNRAVSLLCDPFDEALGLLRRAKAREKFGHALLPGGPAGRDETLNVARILEKAFSVALSPAAHSAAPVLTEADRAEARGIEAGGLGLCPFAGLKHRAHSLERWERLARRVARDWERLYVFGTPAELARWNGPGRKVSPSSFRALGAHLERLAGVVAVDSGPLHLARALGIPSLGLLSGGDSARWFARPGTRDRLLKRGLFAPFPSAWEMGWAYRRWRNQQPFQRDA